MTDTEEKCLFRQYESDTLMEVWQRGNKRQLLFDEKVIQSEILLDRPQQLMLPLHQSLLAGALFSELPQQVLLAGTGGASLVRYFHHHFPMVDGDAVELSASVCDIAKNYFSYPTDYWPLHQQDIQAYLNSCTKKYDLIFFDIAQGKYSPEWLLTIPFLLKMKSMLTTRGHIAFNILPRDERDAIRFLAAIRMVFAQQTVCLSVPNYINMVVFAFNETPKFTHQQIEQRLDELTHFWQIDFSTMWQIMLKENPSGSGVL